MQKELLMILLIVGLPTFFIMSFGPALSGAVVNEVSEMRVERINLALQFPQYTIPMLKQPTYDTRKYLIQGANERYYGPQGLIDAQGFFFQEMQLIPALLQLMCLYQYGEPNQGLYTSIQGVQVHLINNMWYNKQIPYLGKVICDPIAQDAAHRTLSKVFENDFKLVAYTIEKSNCPEPAKAVLQTSKEYYSMGEYEMALDYLKTAVTRASACT
ncbi:MAG: hypothetical protein QW165_02435 [Candidatus Woesearchaeota archaeon]